MHDVFSIDNDWVYVFESDGLLLSDPHPLLHCSRSVSEVRCYESNMAKKGTSIPTKSLWTTIVMLLSREGIVNGHDQDKKYCDSLQQPSEPRLSYCEAPPQKEAGGVLYLSGPSKAPVLSRLFILYQASRILYKVALAVHRARHFVGGRPWSIWPTKSH